MDQFAKSDGVEKQTRYFTFWVSSEIVEQNLDWSQPVRLKFEKNEDGTVAMLLQAVRRHDRVLGHQRRF